MRVDINETYPPTLPVVTGPPALLRVLPELPEVLEYRIVGRDLLLLDTRNQMVVDVLRNVFRRDVGRHTIPRAARVG